jgi:tetratricopeptide (TPR) repeat protein
MNRIGHAWYTKGDYERALQWFDSALAVQQQEPELTYHIAMTMSNKGVLLMMAAQWQPAFTAFEYAADITSRLNFHDELASALGNMGAIKDQIGEYEAALKLYRRAGEALQAAGIHDNHLSVAENEMKIAFVYINQAQWKDALDTLYKVKEIRECILPASHADMGRTWFTIGLVLRSQQRYDEALEHMKRALTIYERAYSYGHPHIANTYNSMANLEAVQGQYAQALPLYEQAKENFRKFYGTDEHPDIACVLNNMGQAHRHLNHLREALDYLDKALHMRQVTLGFNHPDTATTWVNLSLAYRAKGDLKIALQYAQRGLSIRRDKLQPDHQDLIETENFVVQLEQEILALDQREDEDNAKNGGA